MHKFVDSDWARDPHDHPKWFYSVGLWGGYTEEVWDEHPEINPEHRIHRAPFYNAIEPTRVHRIIDPLPHTWTLCLAGPTVKGWGFYTRDGYMDAKDYLAYKNIQEIEENG